jgi:hypothetical protein
MKGRDVYDLAAIGSRFRGDLDRIRKLFAFKVYFDEVEEGLAGPTPFLGGKHVVGRRAEDVVGADDLGVLTGRPLDVAAMLATIEAEFGPMGPPEGEVETTLAACSGRDHFKAKKWAGEFADAAAGRLSATDGEETDVAGPTADTESTPTAR